MTSSPSPHRILGPRCDHLACNDLAPPGKGLASNVDRGVMGRRKACVALLSGMLVARGAAARPLETTQPYRVVDFDWLDRTRSRPVPARLYSPGGAGAGAEAGVPMVVFSHGIGGSRLGYSYLGKYLAANGVASLHVQHVGSDATVWRGNPFGLVGRLQSAAQESEAIARAADVRFALDRMLSEETGALGAMVDRSRLVAAGHSYGANTTLLTVGAQVIRGGKTVDCLDARFSAAVVISAPPFYGETDLSAVLRNIAVPTVHVTATEDVIEIPGYRSGAADRIAVFDAVGDPRKMLAVFRGGSHSMFTDRQGTGGVSLNPKVKSATAELTLAFLDLAFDANPTALTRWRSAWLPILERPPALDGGGFESYLKMGPRATSAT